MLLQQEIQRHWVRELGCAPETAERCIKAGSKIASSFFEDISINGAVPLFVKGQRSLPQPDAAAIEVAELAGGLLDFVASSAIVVADAFEQRREAGHAVAVLGREIGAAVEGQTLRRQEDCHGPAAAAGHR